MEKRWNSLPNRYLTESTHLPWWPQPERYILITKTKIIDRGRLAVQPWSDWNPNEVHTGHRLGSAVGRQSLVWWASSGPNQSRCRWEPWSGVRLHLDLDGLQHAVHGRLPMHRANSRVLGRARHQAALDLGGHWAHRTGLHRQMHQQRNELGSFKAIECKAPLTARRPSWVPKIPLSRFED